MITTIEPEKSLIEKIPYHAGRDGRGRVSIRHRGGRHKRYYRTIDFKRDKQGVSGRVDRIEHDPNRGSHIALIFYKDGAKRYILAPLGLKAGDEVIAGTDVSFTLGNAMPIARIPIGTAVHNVELHPGGGGVLARGAGGSATVLSKEDKYVRMKLPSGEVREIDGRCLATIGQLSNIERKQRKLGKAGLSRHLGFRPTVRGVAQNPSSHPHGGGEGRSGIGMPSPKSPWGKPTLGKRTRGKKLSDQFIIERRKK